MKTQRDAVFSAIVSVLGETGVHFEEGMDVSTHMSRERRALVNQILVSGFNAGEIKLDKTYTEAELKSYVSGLQSNWIRKDKRLNGSVKYVAKNPGSRVGQGDAQLKALKALLSTKTDEDERSEIEAYITERTAQIAAEKSKNVEINYDALPTALRAKFFESA